MEKLRKIGEERMERKQRTRKRSEKLREAEEKMKFIRQKR